MAKRIGWYQRTACSGRVRPHDTVWAVTEKNPHPYPTREHLARRPAPGSYKGLMVALSRAAREIDVPMGAFGARASAFEPGEEVRWSIPSGARPDPLPEKGLGPPIVRVRLPVRYPERTRSQLISAVVQAASHDWYRATDPYGVREPLASLWPQLRESAPRVDGLAEHLEAVIDTPGENSVEWFYHAAETAMEAAFRAGAPVIVAADLVTASGSCASMAPDIPSGCIQRRVSLGVAKGNTLEETVANAVEVLLRGHGIEPASADYARKANHLRAAMLASAAYVPDTPAAAG